MFKCGKNASDIPIFFLIKNVKLYDKLSASACGTEVIVDCVHVLYSSLSLVRGP